MKHRFALCSDTHGQPPPLFRDTRATAVLHAGDVYHAPGLTSLGPFAWQLLEWIKQIKLPVYAVRGNHDFADPAAFFTYLGDSTHCVTRLAPNLLLASLGVAYPSYADLPTNQNLLDLAAPLLIQARKLKATAPHGEEDPHLILLTHYPVPTIDQDKATSSYPYSALGKLLLELETSVGIPILAIVEGHVHDWFDSVGRHDLAGRLIPILRPGPVGGILEIDDQTWLTTYDHFGPLKRYP